MLKEISIKITENDKINIIKLLERNALTELRLGDLNQAKRISDLLVKIKEQ